MSGLGRTFDLPVRGTASVTGVINLAPEATSAERPTTYYPPALSLEGRQAVVVGGTRGLGEAVVHRLVAAGARVVAVGRSEPVRTPASRLILADVTSRDPPRPSPPPSARREASTSSSTWPAVPARPSGGYTTLTDEDWDTELQLNLLAAVRVVRN
jgi:NAD(P)-dependent dehydrogenase (short-subunit alcohol dehydrogenase family)